MSYRLDTPEGIKAWLNDRLFRGTKAAVKQDINELLKVFHVNKERLTDNTTVFRQGDTSVIAVRNQTKMSDPDSLKSWFITLFHFGYNGARKFSQYRNATEIEKEKWRYKKGFISSTDKYMGRVKKDRETAGKVLSKNFSFVEFQHDILIDYRAGATWRVQSKDNAPILYIEMKNGHKGFFLKLRTGGKGYKFVELYGLSVAQIEMNQRNKEVLTKTTFDYVRQKILTTKELGEAFAKGMRSFFGRDINLGEKQRVQSDNVYFVLEDHDISE